MAGQYSDIKVRGKMSQKGHGEVYSLLPDAVLCCAKRSPDFYSAVAKVAASFHFSTPGYCYC